MQELNESEKWIAITSIMKTSQKIKQLPKQHVDYLFINLRRQYASHLSDEEVKNIEKLIDKLAKDIQKSGFKSAMKILGEGDQKEAIKQIDKIFGKQDADTITKLFGKRN